MSLINPTDAELNVAFALHIASYTDIRFEEGEDVDIDSRTIYPWEGWRGTLDGERRHIPRFVDSFDWVWKIAAEKCVVRYSLTTGWMWEVMAWDKDGRDYTYTDKVLSKAIVISLLRAHGVQVEFST